ncbi:MAG: aldo/keto reductase, partial [Bacteroidota bacterium]|nr:aldo/keto reductase [Candidatus Kapabacteria bacterium]MDW8220173.1 aldo/keto reductase [Bacteroidota bacterium]
MKYKLLGRSALRVSELCLGAMGFGEEWGWGASKEESKRIFDAFVKAGGNFIDTANYYTAGTSEKYVGEFIADNREYFVLATKYSLGMRRGDPNAGGNHRKNMVQSLEASLKRLGVDYVDLYWLHMWDYTTPIDEVMRALDDLVRSGKVLHIGVSDTPAWQVARANTLAELHGWSQFVAYQGEYSLIQRTAEREIIPMARAFDVAFTPWAPLAGGALTGKYLRNDPGRLKPDSIRLNERSQAIAREVVAIAEELGCSPAQVALRWTMQERVNDEIQRGVCIPIVGATKESQIIDNLGVVHVNLSEEHMKRL